jgi:hypothetical protein
VMARFEKQAPISVMARLTLEHAIAPSGVLHRLISRGVVPPH